jgi:hypothetical protein
VRELAVPDVSDTPEVLELWTENPRQHFMFAVQNLFLTFEFIADRIVPLTPLEVPVWKVTHGKPKSAV